MLERGPRDGARLGRGRVDHGRRPLGAAAVVRPDAAPAGALGGGHLQVQRLRRDAPDVDVVPELRHGVLREEGREPASRARVRLHVLGEAAHLGVLRRVGLVGQVEEGEALRQRPRDELHPRVGALPGTLLLLERGTRAIEGDRDDRVADALAGALVARLRREVLPVEASPVRLDLRFVVRVHELDPLPVGEAVVGRVEVPALVELGLGGLVVDHRGQAVRVGEREAEDAQLDRERAARPVGGEADRAVVGAGRKLARDVDLDPDRLEESRGRPRAGSPRARRGRSRARAAPAASRPCASAPRRFPASTPRRRASPG